MTEKQNVPFSVPYTFDAVDRVTGRLYPNSSRVTFGYDAAANRTKMEDSTGIYTSTYDALSRIESLTYPAGKRITYAYDGVGRRDSMVNPDGGRTTYAYDAASRTDHLVNPQGDRTTYSYDAAGRRTLKQLANATRASFTYDAADQLTSLANLKSDDSVISSFDYGYDNVNGKRGQMGKGGILLFGQVEKGPERFSRQTSTALGRRDF